MDLKILKIITTSGTSEYNIYDSTARDNAQSALTKVSTALKTAELSGSYDESSGSLTLEIETTKVG